MTTTQAPDRAAVLKRANVARRFDNELRKIESRLTALAHVAKSYRTEHFEDDGVTMKLDAYQELDYADVGDLTRLNALLGRALAVAEGRYDDE